MLDNCLFEVELITKTRRITVFIAGNWQQAQFFRENNPIPESLISERMYLTCPVEWVSGEGYRVVPIGG